MYQHHPRRRKKRPIHGVKTVQVTRGKSGYGFTISGQHPCVLSCIVSGSPADVAGLKPGDYLVYVNNENVSKSGHDDVVRMVGLSTGTLELQVAESYNSSDSSDDDYPPRSKSRYPNRIRPRQGYGDRPVKDKYGLECGARNLPQRKADSRGGNSKHRHHNPVGAESDASGSYQSQNSSFNEGNSHDRTDNSGCSGSANYMLVNSRSNRHSRKQDSKTSLQSIQNATSASSAGSVQFHELHSSQGILGMLRQSSDTQIQGAAAAYDIDDGDEDDSFDIPINGEIRAVVGYIGSIEMPSNASRPHQRLQSLRNAVRRLRIEKKIHTLVLMQVDSDGVRLTNTVGVVIAHYPVERLAFSGVCPDDKRFFGIVTLRDAGDDISEISQQRDDCPSASSCHIFMVDPELRSHSVHVHKAKAFKIQCTTEQEAQRCQEFPRSATPIILSVATLYKDRPRGVYDNDIVQSQAFADPARAAQRSSSNSSNSDSGLGFGKDDRCNERVFVVDMPVEERPSMHNCTSASAPDPCRSAQHLSPEVQTLPTLKNSSFHRPHSAFEARRGLNNSTSSEECWQASKLNPRAMPDPVSLWRPKSSDELEKQNSAENLRHSMHKLLQARQRHLSEQNLSSDNESQASSKSDFLPVSQHGFQEQRPCSAPFAQLSHVSSNSDKVETVDMAVGNPTPRALYRNPMLRSPSAPPITFYPGGDTDDDDDDDDEEEEEEDPFVRGIISRLNRDKALSLAQEESRRYSEGFILAKKREKERSEVEALEKWTKTGSFRRPKGMKIQQPFSQSHESLIAPEGTSQKLAPANSVNSIVAHIAKQNEKNDVGRVAEWAASFDKLLRDSGGLAVFTEFLKKEFSEENILFWRSCEAYKQLINEDQRKVKAKDIFNKYLSPKAQEQVNVDSTSRQQAEKYLDNPTSIMFDMAQQHIFQLMKQDSYARFLKSDLYKMYYVREMEGKPLALPKDDFISETAAKDDKSKNGKGKENEKRRRSLLPWRQNKHKQSGKTSDSELKRMGKEGKGKEKDKEVNNNQKKGPGPGIDLSTMRKEVFQAKEEMRDANDGQFKFCRVVLPDGSTTVVCAKPGQPIRSVLGKLCEKRGLSIAAVDVFLLGSDKPLDLSEDVSSLGSKEVLIERRVLFRMDLPNKKSIGVKAKPNRSIRDVFKPILNKYGFRIDSVDVQLCGRNDILDVEMQVSEIDNERVVILLREEPVEWGGLDGHRSMGTALNHPPLPPAMTRQKTGHGSVKAGSSLDEITNLIFEDLMKGKSEIAHSFDELGIVELARNKVHKNQEEHRLSGLFGLLRKESWGTRDPKQRTKNKVTFALSKNEVKGKKTTPDDEKLFELLSWAQNQRMDDQRGVTTETVEVPEFLRTQGEAAGLASEEPSSLSSRLSAGHRQTISDLFDDVEYMQTDRDRSQATHSHNTRAYSQSREKTHFGADARSIQKFQTFGSPSEKIIYSNQSFSSEGIVPSPEMAETYFLMQPVIIDSGDSENVENFGHFKKMHKPRNKNAYAFRPRSNSLHGNAPMASPERFSPGRTFKADRANRSEEEICEDLDRTLIQSSYRSHDGLSPAPPPPPPSSIHKALIHAETANYTPPPPLENVENKDINEQMLKHSDNSGFQRVLQRNKRTQDLHSLSDPDSILNVSCFNTPVSSIGRPGRTPKIQPSQSHTSRHVLLDIPYGEETITFV